MWFGKIGSGLRGNFTHVQFAFTEIPSGLTFVTVCHWDGWQMPDVLRQQETSRGKRSWPRAYEPRHPCHRRMLYHVTPGKGFLSSRATPSGTGRGARRFGCPSVKLVPSLHDRAPDLISLVLSITTSILTRYPRERGASSISYQCIHFAYLHIQKIGSKWNIGAKWTTNTENSFFHQKVFILLNMINQIFKHRRFIIRQFTGRNCIFSAGENFNYFLVSFNEFQAVKAF